MARIKKNGLVVGKLGDYVYQERDGESILKENNTDVKMTVESKKCSTEFGEANKASAGIRDGLQPYLYGMADTAMHGRFTGAIFHAIRTSFRPNEGLEQVGKRTFDDANLSLLEGFEFNKNTPFREFCSIMPELSFTDGILTVKIDGFSKNTHLKRVPDSRGEMVVIGVAIYNPKSKARTGEIQEFRISGHHPQDVLEWQTQPIPEGKLVVVTAAVIYYGMLSIDGPKVLNNRKLHPCTLLSAFRT